MTISKAIAIKILLICEDKKISINKLANLSYLTQSTVQSIINETSKNPKILTLIKICNGFEITLYDFFHDELFNNIDYDL